MSGLHVKYLLVGGGLASSEAARAIRELDSHGDMLLVGQEIHRPYHRTGLPRELLRWQGSYDQFFTMPTEWYLDQKVQLRTGRRVSHLDTARSSATVSDGEEISFDRLLLATGASPAPLRLPGDHLPNLFYLRSVGDAEAIVLAIEKARKEGRAHTGKSEAAGKSQAPGNRGRVVVIGGGLMGVELAGSLTAAGLEVDLALSREHPWNRLAGETVGKFLTRHLQRNGLRLHCSARAMRLEGDGRVQRVALANGESIDCDFAVAAVGTLINKEILRGAPIAAENAILVDGGCRTNVPGIFAAGDCAAVLDPLFGKHRIMGPCDAAAQMGRIAGLNMAGGQATFDLVSKFDSRVLGLEITSWGEPKLVYRRIIREIPGADSPQFMEIGVAEDGRIAQVIAVGSTRHEPLAAELVRRRVRVDGNEELLRDPAIGLGKILGN